MRARDGADASILGRAVGDRDPGADNVFGTVAPVVGVLVPAHEVLLLRLLDQDRGVPGENVRTDERFDRVEDGRMADEGIRPFENEVDLELEVWIAPCVSYLEVREIILEVAPAPHPSRRQSSREWGRHTRSSRRPLLSCHASAAECHWDIGLSFPIGCARGFQSKSRFGKPKDKAGHVGDEQEDGDEGSKHRQPLAGEPLNRDAGDRGRGVHDDANRGRNRRRSQG